MYRLMLVAAASAVFFATPVTAAVTYDESVSGDIDVFTAATDPLGQPTRTLIELSGGANVFTGSINSPTDPADVLPFNISAGTLTGLTITFSNILIASPAYLNLSTLTGEVLFDGEFNAGTTTITRTLNAGPGGFSFLIGGGVNVADYQLTLNVSAPTPPTTAVPEPATWAMMIGGFGLVGGAMRRRRLTSSVTCA